MRRKTVLLLAGLLGAACRSDDPEEVRAEFERLTADARALVRTGPCASASACAAAPVGARACGGPREHWVYCRTATGEARLLETLRAAARLEEQYNRMTGAISTCEAILPPEVQLDGTECRAR
jgi:hypothetical protein